MSLVLPEAAFRQKVDRALEQVRHVLETNKHPVYASEAAHKYGDKYLLAEFLTNAALASHLTSLSQCGVSAEQLAAMMEWAKTRSVSLRFRASERCTFLKKVTREEDSATQRVTETSHFGTFKSKVVTTITEYLWTFEYTYEMLAYRGTGEADADQLRIRGRSCTHQITTSTDHNPRKESVVRPHIDVNITWLLCSLESPSAGVIVPNFRINREAESCRTPSNNPNVSEAAGCFASLAAWTASVHAYFQSQIYPLLSSQSLDLSAISSDGLFVPVLPIFNQGGSSSGSAVDASTPQIAGAGSSAGSALVSAASAVAAGGVLFGVGEINSFLAEEQRSLTEKYSALDTAFSSPGVLVSSAEACYLVTLLHVRDVVQFHQSGLHAIEEMLRNQLVAAVGKVVSPNDFSNYMRFHNNKVFAEAYRPKPFCYAVRRSTTHSPEGVLSVEEELSDGSMPDPIYTVCSGPSDGSASPMRFTLNAATSVTFHGERFVHAWLCQRFQYSQYDSNESKLFLKATSRQFSSYIVLVGRISSVDSFDPKFGMIVQNKDELSIPLDLERIPSAKEFKDAIDSLSPEQQAFAKAFRGMQLESTLFGVCVIQIKPQLEKLLRLCPDSLTKEIQLTQDLMELFIAYQLPSDLLSFSGAEDAPSSERIAEVKGYVSAMQDMIKASKARELEEKKEQDRYNSNMAYESSQSACSEEEDYCDDGDLYGNICEDICEERCVETLDAMPKKKGGGSLVGKIGSMLSKKSKVKECEEARAPAPRMKSMKRSSRAESSAASAVSFSTAKIAAADGPAQDPQPAETEAIEPPQIDDQTIADAIDESAIATTDYTQIPKLLEQCFTEVDKEGAVRPTIINPGSTWTKRAQKALLAEPTTSSLGVDEQKSEKNRAFDLLDALSRSGGLSVDHASLHVVVAATHCFDRSLMDTIVKNNVNPIEKVERSTMIMASAIHGQPLDELIREEHRDRLAVISRL